MRLIDRLAHSGAEEPHAGHLMAPMSGTVVAVLVKPGEAVAKGAGETRLRTLDRQTHGAHLLAPLAEQGLTFEFVIEGADLLDLDAHPGA